MATILIRCSSCCSGIKDQGTRKQKEWFHTVGANAQRMSENTFWRAWLLLLSFKDQDGLGYMLWPSRSAQAVVILSHCTETLSPEDEWERKSNPCSAQQALTGCVYREEMDLVSLLEGTHLLAKPWALAACNFSEVLLWLLSSEQWSTFIFFFFFLSQ